MSVQDVESEEQRNAEPRFFDGDALNAVCSLRPEDIEQAADPAGADSLGPSSASTGPVTAKPADAMVSWPIFSSSVIAPRRLSISVM